MVNVLVTGGAGYVGSHTCKALAQAGFVPVTFDNLERGHRWAAKWGPFEEGDITNRDRLDEVLRQYSVQAVLHFAAYAYVGESVADPASYYRNNIAGTLTLLESMRAIGFQPIVFSSSCATYGVPETIPISERHALDPVNPYGVSKLVVEHMLRDFGAAYGLRSISLRYFNAAGADPEGEIGEAHDPETHLIPLVLDAALGRRPDITIFGSDYGTPDGTCIRDYTHVSDLADAHVLAVRHLLAGADTEILNLGNGTGFSVKQVMETVRQVTGQDVPVAVGSRRPGDPPVLVADASKAKRVLGWRPRRAALETQITDAWRWHRKRLCE